MDMASNGTLTNIAFYWLIVKGSRQWAVGSGGKGKGQRAEGRGQKAKGPVAENASGKWDSESQICLCNKERALFFILATLLTLSTISTRQHVNLLTR
jgi:hypothetical protein